jgi:hypothetical protein
MRVRMLVLVLMHDVGAGTGINADGGALRDCIGVVGSVADGQIDKRVEDFGELTDFDPLLLPSIS